MASGRPRDPVKERQWRRWLVEQQSSGLSIRTFCGRRGLNESAFYQRRLRLAAQDCRPASPVHPLFVPVDVVAPTSDIRIEIVLAGGQRVHVPRGVGVTTLAQVVAVLEGRAC